MLAGNNILILTFLLGSIFAQNSNINVASNSTLELFSGSKMCTDEITVENGSSFIANSPEQVKMGDCITTLTPTGEGTITLPVEINDIESMPTEFSIKPAYPNPFNPSTTIRYGIPNESEVTILIYDLMGRKVAMLFKDFQQAGWYEITWNGILNNGELAPASMYLYKIKAADEIKTSKISLVK